MVSDTFTFVNEASLEVGLAVCRDDVEAGLDLLRATLSEDPLLSVKWPAFAPFLLRMLRAGKCLFMLARSEGEVVGSAIVWKTTKSSFPLSLFLLFLRHPFIPSLRQSIRIVASIIASFWQLSLSFEAELVYIGISSSRRRLGVGSRLLESILAIESLRPLLARTLCRTPENAEFYVASGFLLARKSLGRLYFLHC